MSKKVFLYIFQEYKASVNFYIADDVLFDKYLYSNDITDAYQFARSLIKDNPDMLGAVEVIMQKYKKTPNDKALFCMDFVQIKHFRTVYKLFKYINKYDMTIISEDNFLEY